MSDSSALVAVLKGKLGSHFIDCFLDRGDAVVIVSSSDIPGLFPLLKYDADLAFDFLVSITAVDWLEKRPDRFEVVYHLMSYRHLYRLRIKVPVSGAEPQIASVVDLWRSANIMEREVWDMFGIKFVGHPDLRRVLMYPEFVGYPLRKDYPVRKKQPRIPSRHTEVRNSSLDLVRPSLTMYERGDE